MRDKSWTIFPQRSSSYSNEHYTVKDVFQLMKRAILFVKTEVYKETLKLKRAIEVFYLFFMT